MFLSIMDDKPNNTNMNIKVETFVIPIKLNGKNWNQWSTYVRHHLTRRSQISHLTKNPPNPITMDWEIIDSDILCTLWEAMEPELYSTAMTCQTAKALWDHLVAIYSGSTSMSHAYAVSQAYSRCTQGTRSLFEYYTYFKKLVDELEECFPLSSDPQILRERQDKLHVLTFIGGLSPAHDSVRPMLLGHFGTTTIQSTYSLLREMFTESPSSNGTLESSTLAAGRGTGCAFGRGGGRFFGSASSRGEKEEWMGSWASWGKKDVKADETGWNTKASQSPAAQAVFPLEDSSKADRWGTKESWKAQAGSSASWGKAVQKTDVTSWNKGGKLQVYVASDSASTLVDGFGEKGGENARPGKWGSLESDRGRDKSEVLDWSKKVEEKPDSKDGWGAQWGKKEKSRNSGWNDDNKPQPELAVDTTAEGSNEKGNEETDKSSNWGSADAEKAPEKPGSWGWNRRAEQKSDQGEWKEEDGWGSFGGGEWKNKRERPARPVGGTNDGSRSSRQFTSTRQRLDIFTSDEQDILTDIEPIMQSIRRIMHQYGYIDGNPLSADDQTYILDNVFNHHPDKAQKMGAGVNYIMVTKHMKFQESRCFYVVSTDGRKVDFSYRKCLENFIRGKYPDKVEEFMPKYFKEPQPRPVGNRERGSGPYEAGTPRSLSGWKRGSSVVPDEARAPRSWSGWNCGESSVAADEAGTPRSQSGWNRETSVAADEAGTPVSGWNKESSTAPDEGGPPSSGWNQAGSSITAADGGTPQSGWGS